MVLHTSTVLAMTIWSKRYTGPAASGLIPIPEKGDSLSLLLRPIEGVRMAISSRENIQLVANMAGTY